jgi:hypothetical protein
MDEGWKDKPDNKLQARKYAFAAPPFLTDTLSDYLRQFVPEEQRLYSRSRAGRLAGQVVGAMRQAVGWDWGYEAEAGCDSDWEFVVDSVQG